ncbi:MAG: DUF4157 domain-containing protein [Pseudomonadota bacterium]|nr:DUF4157 domain-containing protein [Pseudomonadota bacterium]
MHGTTTMRRQGMHRPGNARRNFPGWGHGRPVSQTPVSDTALANVMSASCSCGGHCPGCRGSGDLPSVINIGLFDDHYEREADAVAERAMKQAPVGTVSQRAASAVQRKTEMQSRDLQIAGDVQTHGLLSGSGEALSPSLNYEFATRLGYDFSKVRIHRDHAAGLASDSLGARAFTLGRHIAFARGEYAPDTNTGKQLLAHELAHVVQQQRQPMLQRKVVSPGGHSLDDYLIQKGVSYSGKAPVYTTFSIDYSSQDNEILSSMLASDRLFYVEPGKTEQDTQNNLGEHVDVRKRIVKYTAMKQYHFGVDSNTRVNPKYWGSSGSKYYVKPKMSATEAYEDMIKSSSYSVSCHMATKVTMLAGTGDRNLVRDTGVKSGDWIPGDWGYVDNVTYMPVINQPGEEGENIIYVGNGRYWGHISSAQTYKSLPDWVKLVKQWGFPMVKAWRERPINGLIK